LSGPGARLVADLSSDDDPYAVSLLIVEAGRVADRLDALAGLLSGERSSWIDFKHRGSSVTVTIDGALSEARQQAGCLRGLLGEIRRQRADKPGVLPADDDLAGL
jgi:hypothetical protein